MADKKEVNILLLGIVAILAIVGLVLLFTSPAATGRYSDSYSNSYKIPSPILGVQAPAGIEGPGVAGGQVNAVRGGGANAVYVTQVSGLGLGLCSNGQYRVAEQGNYYKSSTQEMCRVFTCPGTNDPPVEYCQPRV